jgi:sodium transport system ATP-binding protein
VDDSDVIADPIGSQRFMGLLPDARGLYPRMTAREHIRYFGELRGLTGVDLNERTERLVHRLGLEQVADRRVAGFSQGERTKVALARALVHAPRNVMLDEPTNGLDVMSTRAVRALIRGLREDGCCVVFSSHIMQEVAALCDRIVVIAQGTVVADGTAAELRQLTGRADLEDAFVTLAGLDPEAHE